VVIFQPRDNSQPLSFSGPAAADLNGLVYAPSAVASVSSTLPLEQTTLVVDELQVSGNGSAIPYPASGGSSGASPTVVATPAAVAPQGPLGLAVIPPPASPGTGSRSDGTSPPNGVVSTPGPVSLAASSRPVAMAQASGSDGEDALSIDPELLTEVAVSLLAGLRDGIEGSAPARSKART
jgi:hypothetical protein